MCIYRDAAGKRITSDELSRLQCKVMWTKSCFFFCFFFNKEYNSLLVASFIMNNHFCVCWKIGSVRKHGIIQKESATSHLSLWVQLQSLKGILQAWVSVVLLNIVAPSVGADMTDRWDVSLHIDFNLGFTSCWCQSCRSPQSAAPSLRNTSMTVNPRRMNIETTM